MNFDTLPIRDIHVPEPVGWWPPAPGWWLLLAALVLSAALAVWLRRRWRARHVKRLALDELSRLRYDHELAPSEKLRRLSVLLRRAALSAYPRAEVAGLTGHRWLAFLDRQLPGEPFSRGCGAVLQEIPYRHPRQSVVDLQPLFEICEEWIKKLPEARR